MGTVDVSKFDEATRKLEAAWKTRMARKGSEYPPVYTIPTGSDELDWAMYGGWAINRTNRVYGGESTAKTMLMWLMMRNAQNIHHIYRDRFEVQLSEANSNAEKNVLEEERDAFLARFPDGMEINYYNVENQFHPKFVQSWGVDTDRLNVIDGDVIEQICDAMQNYMSSVHVHVVDSTTAASPLRLINADPTDELRGVDAARWKDGLRQVEHHFSEDNTLFLISQVTNNQETKAEEPVGGRKMNFSSSMSLHTKKGSWLYYDSKGILVNKKVAGETISGLKEPDGIEITARVAKSRVCPPLRTARTRMDLYRGLGIDKAYEISQAAKFYGIVEKNGPAYICLLDGNGEKIKPGFHGEAEFREYINENPDFVNEVKEIMMNSGDSRAGDTEIPDDVDPEPDL